MNEVEISLFPIPGSVTLPFTIVPLHIFEPRYRKMIKDSIDQNRRIGVAHSKREISPSKVKESATEEEMLSSNQESYEAHPVFSAGFAEILETLPDGRMIVQIKMDSRYEITEELQQVPYKVVRCKPYDDEESFEESSILIRDQLDETLLRLPVSNAAKLRAYIESINWKSQSAFQYSFSIYSLVIFEPEILQRVLEIKSTFDRISFLKDALSNPTNN